MSAPGCWCDTVIDCAGITDGFITGVTWLTGSCSPAGRGANWFFLSDERVVATGAKLIFRVHSIRRGVMSLRRGLPGISRLAGRVR